MNARRQGPDVPDPPDPRKPIPSPRIPDDDDDAKVPGPRPPAE